MARIHEEIRATLTPEQQPKFDALVAQLHERRRHALGLEGP
jgi:hypothetical protein